VIRSVAVDHYRSLRRVRFGLSRVNVVTGPNGSGKSNVYRALRLLGDCARVGAGAALAAEGGLWSALWAGSPSGRPDAPIALRMGYGGDDFGYAIDLGLPVPSGTVFKRDPEIKVAVLRPLPG
jgi:predicted ATPase